MSRLSFIASVTSTAPTHTTMAGHEAMRVFATAHNISVADLTRHCRKKPMATIRQDAMAYVRDVSGLSFPEVGLLFNRDHTTILHGVRASEKRRATA